MLEMYPTHRLEDRRRQRVEHARRLWPEIPAGDLAARGRYLVDQGSGNLWEVVRTSMWHGEISGPSLPLDESAASAFYVDADGDPIPLRRPPSGAQTVADLEAAEQEAERKRAEAAEAHARFLASQRQVEVKLADLEGRPLPTLREAARQLLDAGGRIERDGARLRVSLPERVSEVGLVEAEVRRGLYVAARVVVAASEVVHDALGAPKGKRLDERLPDRQVAAGGGVV